MQPNLTPDPTPAPAPPALLSADPTTTHIDALLDTPAAEAPSELHTDTGKLKADMGAVAKDVKQIVEDLLG